MKKSATALDPSSWGFAGCPLPKSLEEDFVRLWDRSVQARRRLSADRTGRDASAVRHFWDLVDITSVAVVLRVIREFKITPRRLKQMGFDEEKHSVLFPDRNEGGR